MSIVQAPPLSAPPAQQPAPTQFTDLSDLSDQLNRFKMMNEQDSEMGPVQGWAGGLARLLGALGTAWAAKNTQSKIDSGRQANAKLLAQVLSGNVPGGGDAATFLASSTDPQMEKLGLSMIESKAKANTYRAPTAAELQSYHLSPNGSYQVDRDGKITPLPSNEAKAPTLHDFVQGGSLVTKQWGPSTQTWKALSSGARWKPKDAGASPQFGDATPPWEMK